MRKSRIINVIKVFFLISMSVMVRYSHAQMIPAGELQIEELIRRKQISDSLAPVHSMFFRPLYQNINDTLTGSEFIIRPTNFFQRNTFNTVRPYGWGDGPMISQVGFQQYFSLGLAIENKFLFAQFQPEIVWAQNKPYLGFVENASPQIVKDRFFFWNFSDTPEILGRSPYKNAWWGQSALLIHYRAFEMGFATRNIWWGPGQFNSLSISRNAPGFLHFTLNTRKPARTFIGNFEGQIIIGRLENSNRAPSQSEEFNNLYFLPFDGDWRYLNGMTISYQPKWLPGLFFGFSRTFQQYNQKRTSSFNDILPILSPFQKIKYGFDKDGDGRDQQAVVSGRYVNIRGNFEFYFEYGRRDHAFNWREAIINPEHARAFLMGFNKLINLNDTRKKLFVRGEITHQQESINRYIRYRGLLGGVSWHTHNSGARGFVNFGQPLGVGIGTGSNVQTFEVSLVENYNKLGLVFERLENHQDFYYRVFGQQTKQQPWIDFSAGLIFDREWKNLIMSSRLQFINAKNYQWIENPASTEDFPQNTSLFSTHFQLNFIYRLNRYFILQ
ncbi:capsule assembly Wzi family protein [Aquiflexum sp. LQ15W]|uniref:capsule assembly Wzi family protein n=1 Tax=Cognataquiflexum nitidum TaxID=2922272 RepID=UPI001F137DBA|nr:capsule assembly Wzi family protein [Cognataquiflexum nitidum]MCH6198337.1 capsule assembly Wzi family protein [Cognataquiflexum nitidum]